MKSPGRRRVLAVLAPLVLAALSLPETALAQAAKVEAKSPSKAAAGAGLLNETPATFVPVTDDWDYARRDVMIPMRDGVRLNTVILVPKGAKGAPILLTRTPYDAKKLTGHAKSAHLGRILQGYDNATDVIVEGGYIRVVQDVRGKYGSEGDYVMNRPLRGPWNPTSVDHATDTFDTIDWLVKNVPESNGRVGILGISYDGFLPLMALVNPHPALKVAVPMNPMVDGWMGDDWFHHGAFRQQNLPYIHDQEATRGNDVEWWTSHYDDYDMYLKAGSAGELGRQRGVGQVGFWRKILAHPSYDAFWKDQAMDRVLADQPLKVPVMIVHSLWDQEDIYGAIAVWKALAAEGCRGRQGLSGPRPLVPRPGDRRRQHPRRDEVRQRHGAHVPAGHPATLPRPVPQGRRAEGRRGEGVGVRDRDERLAAPAGVARGLRERVLGEEDASLPRRRPHGRVRGAEARRTGVRGVRLGSRQAGPVPRAPDPGRGIRRGRHVVAMARGRPARGVGPPGRSRVRLRSPHVTREDQR